MSRRSRSTGRYKRLLRRAILVLVVIVVVVGFRLVEKVGQESSLTDRFVVVRVIDGDTIELQGGDKVRLLAIDTPEKGQRYYREATEFLSSLVLGKAVRIEYGDERRDRYGRLLGFVYEDSMFVNRAILENGLGYLYLFKDDDISRPEVDQMLIAQREALASQIGIWSLARSPEKHYINIAGSLRFHRPGCRSAQNLKPGRYQTFQTREEAAALGLSPCRNCKP